MSHSIVGAAWVPGLPQLLHPEKSPKWQAMAEAYQYLAGRLESEKPDVIVLYSTQWVSVLGTSFQVQKNPVGTHVDDNWYEFGDLPYDIKVDSELGKLFAKNLSERFPAKAVDFESFPIDTGTIVPLSFLNPEGKIPVSIVSSWIYADGTKTELIAASMKETLKTSGKRAFLVASSLLSTRYFTKEIDPGFDEISAPEDDKWNKRILGHLESGEFSQVAALSEAFGKESLPDMQFNAFHWLNGLLGGEGWFGHVLNYGPIWGTGAAVIDFRRR